MNAVEALVQAEFWLGWVSFYLTDRNFMDDKTVIITVFKQNKRMVQDFECNTLQAWAELCQAQGSLQLNLANYKLSSIQLKSSNQLG